MLFTAATCGLSQSNYYYERIHFHVPFIAKPIQFALRRTGGMDSRHRDLRHARAGLIRYRFTWANQSSFSR